MFGDRFEMPLWGELIGIEKKNNFWRIGRRMTKDTDDLTILELQACHKINNHEVM